MNDETIVKYPSDEELAEFTKGSDEQLDRIEEKLDTLLSHVEQVKEGIATAQKNPLVRQMLKQYGFSE